MIDRRLFLQAALAAAAHAAGVADGLAATQGGRRMPRVIVCDVNETLLDVALEPDFKEVFGDAYVLQDWRIRMSARVFSSCVMPACGWSP